jgi:hydrogenase nickel incorporation protein HypA/HybF
MHELSIALRIVETVETALANEPDAIVKTVNIRIGTLTGLVPEALAFSWEVATSDSRLCSSELAIEIVNATGFCPTCRTERTIDSLQAFCCPVCKAPIAQITGGNELEIMTVEVIDPENEMTVT